ncbi:DUF1015 domain-containing protein [Streptomyces sp. 7-21]|jgi:uncharacterized protein (DUF1015 family)|uniref:DUF1015 domain-containing protein n=1 Tax=Streptomyces sp. 7-21 TaxID=2802283 RepID=UPI00191D8ECC|nr:DUF1015 domain-containing protein [Streptomyces sp. 7-21]MBL1068897.1 DUF1015 domain-containing protein [Streptomyces sp. 7-21]
MPADGLDLAPFRGVRYAPDRVGGLAAVTSPPYDVVVRPEGLRALETADPHNIVRLILPQASAPGEAHRRAAATLRAWRAEGVLVRDPEPAFYVYEQRHGSTVTQRGIIGALRLTPPERGIVLPHEDTVPEVVAERASLLRATAANLEPLLLTYRGGGPAAGTAAVIARAAARPPLLAATAPDGTGHRLWAVTAPADQETVRRGLATRRAMIADGHHRWATYLRLHQEHGGAPPWDRGLVLLVDADRYPLRVRPIHRVFPGLPPAEALARAAAGFRVRPLGSGLEDALAALAAVPPSDGNAMVVAGGGGFHLLDRPDPALLARTVPAGRPEAWRRLDTAVLRATLLGTLWRGTAAGAVRYVHDAAAAVAAAARSGGSAVLLRPVAEETVRGLAERGVTLPEKATSFGPKPATGLVLRLLDEGGTPDCG